MMFKGLTNNIVIFFIYISIFINSYIFIQKPTEIYFGYIVYLLLPIFILRHPTPRILLAIFLLLLLSGLLNIFLGNNTYPQFFKIFLGVFFSYLFYYYVVVQFEYNVEKLFQLYLTGCYIVSIIGIIQFVSYQLHFVPGYDYHWLFNKWGVTTGGNFGIRVNSVFGEPTYFGSCVSAGAFISIYNLLVKHPYYLSKFKSIIILVAFLLTFSSVAYYAIFMSIIILLLNFGFVRYVLIFIPILLGIFIYLYNNVSEFRERYDDTIDIFLTGEWAVGKTHGSSIILYNNYKIAISNFSDNFLFGGGLGSHPMAFSKYSILTDTDVPGITLQNSQDANSMLLRIISETGLFGTVLMLFIAFGCFIKKALNQNVAEHFWLISGAILTMILTNFLRQGHYFLNGFPFFIWLYYFNYVKYKKDLEKKNEL